MVGADISFIQADPEKGVKVNAGEIAEPFRQVSFWRKLGIFR